MTMGNSRQCLRRSKQHETDLFRILPLDLIVEILLKIPAKSIAKLVFVSKQWSSITQSKDFINLYLARSSNRLRLLSTVFSHYEKQQFLYSCSQKDPSSDHHDRLNITQDRTHVHGFSPPVRGLICRQNFNDAKLMIGNPSTGQFITLPKVKTKKRGIYSFFGYDPVNDVYKILCMTVLQVRQSRGSSVVSEEHQVYTLGAKQKWRMIPCKHPHLPPYNNKGVCINGVMYYYAWIGDEGTIFDLSSEDFNVVKLPEDNQWLVNYNGKIALTWQFEASSTLHLWVLEDAKKQEWSKVSIDVPSWIDLKGGHGRFEFRGTLGTGELIFAMFQFTDPFYFITYDPKEKDAKKVGVEGIGVKFASYRAYFDHVESPMLLQM